MVRLDARRFGRNCDLVPWARFVPGNQYARWLNASSTGCVLRAWGF